MAKMKRLYAIHHDGLGKYYRTKIAEGHTGDFAQAVGFQVEDFEITDSSKQSLGLNGSYPTMLEGDHSNLVGKILTLCDATFTNKDQKDAFKSIIKETMWSHFTNSVMLTENSYLSSETNNIK